ncbi:MAG: ATP-binding protein [Lentimicrobium sp.]
MERIRNISRQKTDTVKVDFKRYLYNKIDWNNRLIAIKGARGVGKTTLLLQYIKEHDTRDGAFLYASLDDIYFTAHSLVEFAEVFYKEGGKVLLLDEVHKYPGWSREIKNIYDSNSELQLIFTSSSILQLFRGYADLSRRIVSYELYGLSYREYLEMTGILKIPSITMQEILDNHTFWESEIVKQIRPLKHFREYLQYGYYPYFIENIDAYYQKLMISTNLTLEYDLPSALPIEYANIHKLKKLLYILATSVPFTPNISRLSEQIQTTRATVLQYLDHLKNAQIINLLNTDSLGSGYLTKPDKIYLQNTNIMYALAPEMVNAGNLRETFFYNQLGSVHNLALPKQGDFIVNKRFVFEIGGKNKTYHQISNIQNSYIAADDIEYGFKNKIPLWLFGFLY